MTVEFNSRIRPADNVMYRDVENESVLLNLNSESYFGLNDVGTRMWSVVIASDSVQTAYDTLTDEFDVDPEILRKDLSDLIEDWLKHGLVRIETD